METLTSTLSAQVLGWTMAGIAPVLIGFAIRYLHNLTEKTKWGRKSEIDDMVFSVLSQEADTFFEDIGKANNLQKKKVKAESAAKAIHNTKSRLTSLGIRVAKSYSDEALNLVLNQAVHQAKKYLPEAKSDK